MIATPQKKPKRIVRQGITPSRIVVRPRDPRTRVKLRSTLPAPGGVGHLFLVLRGQ